jgi:polar amino acid transport system substrate-binding protein
MRNGFLNYQVAFGAKRDTHDRKQMKVHIHSLIFCILMIYTASLNSQTGMSMDTDKSTIGKELLHVGLVITTPPRSYYTNSDPSQPLTGYEPDILNEVAKRLKKEIVYYDVAWAGLFTGLLAQKWDVAASNIFINEERQAMMDFSEPHFDTGMGMLVGIQSDISSLEDIKGKVLGVDIGSGAEVWLRENMDRYGPYQIQSYNGTPDVFLDVQTGRLDGGVSDLSIIDWYIASHKSRLRRGTTLGETYNVGFAFRKNSPLIRDVNEAIREMKKDGTIGEIYKKYHGVYPDKNNSAYVLYEKEENEY